MQANYRLVYKAGGKYVKLAGETCHATKSAAGRLFQQSNVDRVFVCDTNGVHFLYLVKGQPSKTENVKSSTAPLG